MVITSLKENLVRMINSIVFPIILATLSYFAWVIPNPWSWLFVSFYFILVFFPLVSEDGRGYLPLFFFPLVFSSELLQLSTGLPVSLILSYSFFLVSLILYIIIHRPKMVTGSLFFSLLALYLVFLISFVYSTITTKSFGKTPVLYLICFFLVLTIYTLVSSVLGKKETMPYYAYTIAIFGIAIALETITRLLSVSGFHFAAEDFSIGWANTKEIVSTVLTLTLPFYCILINRKKGYWSIPLIFIIATLIFLSTDSGLLSLILFSIPLVILSLRNYGRAFPYYTLFVLLSIGITIGVLMGVNQDFNNRVVKAVTSVNLFDPFAHEELTLAFKSFTSNIILGPSIASLTISDGFIQFTNNTVVSTLQMGGLVGFGAFIIYEILAYFQVVQKKAQEKWFIFIFLLMVEFIGLLSQTIYHIGILSFVLITLSVYRQSNRPEDVVIHDLYYEKFDHEEVLLRNQNTI